MALQAINYDPNLAGGQRTIRTVTILPPSTNDHRVFEIDHLIIDRLIIDLEILPREPMTTEHLKPTNLSPAVQLDAVTETVINLSRLKEVY
eukprot:scaffold3429_cov232-Chaetoceros_neogracile.AAC.1